MPEVSADDTTLGEFVWAMALTFKGSSRQVGVCLKHLPDNTTVEFHNGNVPWQRVINAQGVISQR
jgi:alkylated DNA nucleotide flippase Atl1